MIISCFCFLLLKFKVSSISMAVVSNLVCLVIIRFFIAMYRLVYNFPPSLGQSSFSTPFIDNNIHNPQKAIASKMADVTKEMKTKFLEATYKSTAFLLTRFPYASAIFLMLSTAESFKTNLSVEKNKLTLSHIHLGVFFVSATAMSFNLFGTKRLFALITAAQYVALSVEEYMDKNRRETIMVSLQIL